MTDDGRGAAWAETRRERLVGIALLVGVFAWHAAILLRLPVVGAAENGDFWRVLRPAGIVSFDPREAVIHQYVSQTYGVSASALGRGLSSAALIAVAAKALAPGADTFDIRQMGAAYLALYAIAFAVALSAGVPAMLCALLAWAALDVSYSLYCNSFFVDPAALLGILGVALALLAWSGDGHRRWASPGLLVGAALVAGFSKNLYLLTPWGVAAAVLLWPSRRWAAHLRLAALPLLALLVGGALSTWYFTVGGGYRFPDINTHHAVFRGVVEVADDPAAVLAELGIDPRLVAFSGRSFFELSEAERRTSAAALAGVSRGRILIAYLRHPRRLARAASRLLPSLRETTTADPNFSDRSQPPALYRGWWQFARLRGALPWLAALLLGAGVLGLISSAGRRQWSGGHAAFAFLLANAMALMIGSVLGDGFFGLSRHVMGVRFSLDLALALVLYAAYARLRHRPRMTALVGTLVELVTSTWSTRGSWQVEVPRSWRTASMTWFMPWM
jgi:hypothetical protein